jgi:hypothetical protein
MPKGTYGSNPQLLMNTQRCTNLVGERDGAHKSIESNQRGNC